MAKLYMIAEYASAGCLPDSVAGPVAIERRRDMVDFVDSTLEEYEFPARWRRQVNMATAWRLRCGGAWFRIDSERDGDLYGLTFRFVSEEEARQMGETD